MKKEPWEIAQEEWEKLMESVNAVKRPPSVKPPADQPDCGGWRDEEGRTES